MKKTVYWIQKHWISLFSFRSFLYNYSSKLEPCFEHVTIISQKQNKTNSVVKSETLKNSYVFITVFIRALLVENKARNLVNGLLFYQDREMEMN